MLNLIMELTNIAYDDDNRRIPTYGGYKFDSNYFGWIPNLQIF